jgi:pyruvate/2-oxoglutarate dehydrogenase complex dihydrolipoamide dehydrogenase (E3) component
MHANATEGIDIKYVHPTMDSATLKREYILLATGARTSVLPGIPALIHGEKMIVGNEVIAYLQLNPKLK